MNGENVDSKEIYIYNKKTPYSRMSMDLNEE